MVSIVCTRRTFNLELAMLWHVMTCYVEVLYPFISLYFFGVYIYTREGKNTRESSQCDKKFSDAQIEFKPSPFDRTGTNWQLNSFEDWELVTSSCRYPPLKSWETSNFAPLAMRWLKICQLRWSISVQTWCLREIWSLLLKEQTLRCYISVWNNFSH